MKDDYGHMRVGIVGAGHIAGKICDTLSQMEECSCTAIASRRIEKATRFAERYCIPKAYGSYAELLDDPDIDLVYIATPHSHHHDIAMDAIRKGKPCLIEKAFMANARLAKEVLDLAAEKKVFVAEAIWTRYMPSAKILDNLMRMGVIGDTALINASLAYPIADKPRIVRPDLCGGALLDLGVYAINFMLMVHPGELDKVTSNCVLSPDGIDMQDSMSFTYKDGAMGNLQCSACCANDKHGVISGTDGYIVVDNINNPQSIKLYSVKGHLLEDFDCSSRITGYEYEFLACRKALAEGLLEPEEMPHGETLKVMEIMDGLRKEWGVRFPMD